MRELWRHSGDYIVQVRNIATNKIVRKYIIHNQITDLARNELIKGFQGDYVNLQIGELAIGTGTTNPSSSDNKLENEVYRVTVSESDKTDTGVNTSSFTLNGNEWTGTITEIGIFVGLEVDPWGGGAGKDSGILLSRVLANITIAAGEEAVFQRIDTISA